MSLVKDLIRLNNVQNRVIATINVTTNGRQARTINIDVQIAGRDKAESIKRFRSSTDLLELGDGRHVIEFVSIE